MPEAPRYRQVFAELKRRHVFRVAAVYGATAFVIIQAADVVFPRIPLPEWTVSLVVWLALLAFPVAVVLAWAYERTPEGVRTTDPAAAGELEAIASEPMRRRWPAGLAALAGVLLLGLGAWWALTRTGPGARTYDSIAVLPFADLAEGDIDSYFSDGLSDELISALAGVGDLKVAGRTSSYALREANLDLRAIGDTLGVDAVLEGSVRRSADRVRIGVQLVDAATGYNLWSEEYDRDITDIFRVQEELAQSIVHALLPKLSGTPRELYRGGTDDLAAYELYLACRQKWYTRNHELLYQAIDDCDAALARDADFALAWSGLSDAIDALAYRDARVLHLIPRARMAAQRAVLLDPSLADGWASWGTLASEADRDWVTAELALRRAIELKPSNAYARAMLADLLRYRGRIRESIDEHRSARDLDPLSPVIRGVLAISLGVVGEYPESRVLFEQNLREGVDEAAAHGFLFLWGPEYGLSGDEMGTHAIELLRILGATEPERAAVIGQAFASGEDDPVLRAEARAVADGIVSQRVLPLRQVASLYTRLGNPEAALARLEAADPSLDVSLNLVGVDPSLDPLREDPRMRALTERLGLPNGYDRAADASAPGAVP